eukprot:scaffold1066_cov289-Alexandrium_tamarense.AAC.1
MHRHKTTQRSYIPPFNMTSIKRSNAATLYPSSLYDDDIEAALKTNLLTENEKDISCAGAEYDSDDDEEDNKHISLAMKINNCYSFAIRLLWVLTTWVLLIQNMWVNQTFWIRPNCTFILLLVFSHVSLLSVWGQVCMNKYSIAHPPVSFLFGTQEALQQTHPPVPLLGDEDISHATRDAPLSAKELCLEHLKTQGRVLLISQNTVAGKLASIWYGGNNSLTYARSGLSVNVVITVTC